MLSPPAERMSVEPQEVREDYYAGLEEKRIVSIAKARENNYKIDFVANPPPLRPNKLGVTVIDSFSMHEVGLPSAARNTCTNTHRVAGGEIHRLEPVFCHVC